MRSFRKELWFNLPRRMGFVDITGDVEACLSESGIREGLCLVKTWSAIFLPAVTATNPSRPVPWQDIR